MAGSFGARLRELREEAGLSRERLARMADMSTSGVTKLEVTDTDPNWTTVRKLAKALGVSCSAFEVDGENGEAVPVEAQGKE